MLELIGVSKTFQGVTALARTDLVVPDGQTTVLIGPSGSGKSTLLRLMIGLLAPDTGSVRFQGMLLTPQNVLALRRRMGYVVQDGGLFPHLTARQNITLMAGYLGWDASRISQRLNELAGFATVSQSHQFVEALANTLVHAACPGKQRKCLLHERISRSSRGASAS